VHIKFKKCTFAQQQLSYLDHIISKHGVSTDHSKTIAMLEWPVPSNFIELRFFGINRILQKIC
jgi:hypothetical protein